MPEYIHSLVATLGGQPQVVTFTLDLLPQRGFPIREVIVLHPKASQPRLQDSLTHLSAEFVGDQYCFNGRPLTIHFRSHVLRLDDEPLNDIHDSSSANGTLDTIQHLISDLKRQHRHIHLSVTGGRRLMSLLALSVAFLTFDRQDHIWHIYTPDVIQQQAREGKQMHTPTEDDIALIEGPFVPWGAYFPHLSELSNLSAATTRLAQQASMDAEEHERCKQVVQQAKPRQIDVLKAFAEGKNPQEVANTLCLSIKTVDTHKTALLSLCRNAWNKSAREIPDYRFLQKAFAHYFEQYESST